MPIQCEHITKQHGGTAFTEEITHYAAVSHKKIFQLHFHCACWCEFVWKWISMADGNRALTDGEKGEGGEKGTDGGQASLFWCRLFEMWPAYRFASWWEMWKNKWSIHLQKGLEDDKERWMKWKRGTVWKKQESNKGKGSKWWSLLCATSLLVSVHHGHMLSTMSWMCTGMSILTSFQDFRKESLNY